MKQLKLIIFIFVIMLIQTLVSVYINLWGVVPNVMLAFVIAYAVCEREMSYVLLSSILCGVMMSVISQREFFLIMLMFLYSGVLAYLSQNSRRKVQNSIRTILFVIIFTFFGESIIYLLSNMEFSVSALMGTILPAVIYNTIVAIPVYFVTDKYFNEVKKRQKFIIS